MSAYTGEPTILSVKRLERQQELQPTDLKNTVALPPETPTKTDQVSKLITQHSTLTKFPQLFYEVESLCSSIREMEIAAKKEKERIGDLELKFAQERAKYQNGLSETSRKMQDLNLLIQRAKTDLHAYHSKEKTLLNQIKSQIDQLTATRNELQATKQALALRQQKHAAETEQFKTLIQNERAQTNALKTEIQKLKEEHEKDTLLWKDQQEGRLRTQMLMQAEREDHFNKQISVLRFEIQKSKVEEKKFLDKIDELHNKLTEVSNQALASQEKISSLNIELEKTQQKTSGLEAQLIQSRKEIEIYKSREKQYLEAHRKLQQNLSKVVEELTALKQTKDQLQKDLEAKQTEIQTAQTTHAALQVERSKLQNEHNQLKSDQAKLVAENQELRIKAQTPIVIKEKSSAQIEQFLTSFASDIQKLQEEVNRIPKSDTRKDSTSDILNLIIEQKDILENLSK